MIESSSYNSVYWSLILKSEQLRRGVAEGISLVLFDVRKNAKNQHELNTAIEIFKSFLGNDSAYLEGFGLLYKGSSVETRLVIVQAILNNTEPMILSPVPQTQIIDIHTSLSEDPSGISQNLSPENLASQTLQYLRAQREGNRFLMH